MPTSPITKQDCEYTRQISRDRFSHVRPTWVECGKWALPHRIKWLLSQMPGTRTNQHIVDNTHVLALRSYVAGFLEGNTSASRPWYRIGTPDPDINNQEENHLWLDRYTRRTLQVLSTSNFYHAAGQFYYDFGVFNTGAHYIEQTPNGLFFFTLDPGSYFVLNNGYGEAVVLVREFSLTAKALVDTYGKKDKHGKIDWSNISSNVRKMYEEGNYSIQIEVVHVVKENAKFDPSLAQVGMNRKWISVTYERGISKGEYLQDQGFGAGGPDPLVENVFLNVQATRRKPFLVGRSDSTSNFEYGEKGPTLDALGAIKSLNKKAIAKDQAIEQMLRPPLQGPASLRKSYISSAPNTYVPLDPTSLSQKGLRSIYEVNPAIQALVSDVADMRAQVGKLYYEDYLLYLSQNPKTRTATETSAVVQEQQLVIGPNLQSLNWTYNVPILDFVMDYVLFDDPVMQQYPAPKALEGNFLRPEFISVFAQAQKAADLPAIDRFTAMAEQVGQIRPEIWDKVNLDKLADLYEDRLFLPAGLCRPQAKVDAMRQQAMAQQQQQTALHETIPALAQAAKNVGAKLNQPGAPKQAAG